MKRNLQFERLVNISLVHVLIYRLRSRGLMETSSWMHRDTKKRYRKSVTVVVVALVAKAVVTGCVVAMTVPEEAD